MHPILFKLGSLPIRAYGVLMIIGFLLGLWRAMTVLAKRQISEPEGSPRRINPDKMFDFSIVMLMIGLVGARVLYVILNWKAQFASDPTSALKLWEGGLAVHGAILFGLIYLLFFCKRNKISPLALADVIAPSFSIAYVFGRAGCLLNGCCYGGECDPKLPWAMSFHKEGFSDAVKLFTPPSHPTQLYAILFNLFFFGLLILWERKSRKDGELFFGYVAMYGVYRYVVEIFRVGGTSAFIKPNLFLSLAQVASIGMIVLGVGVIVWLRMKPAQLPKQGETLVA